MAGEDRTRIFAAVTEFDPFRLISGTAFVGDQGGVSKRATGKPGRTSRFSGY